MKKYQLILKYYKNLFVASTWWLWRNRTHPALATKPYPSIISPCLHNPCMVVRIHNCLHNPQTELLIFPALLSMSTEVAFAIQLWMATVVSFVILHMCGVLVYHDIIQNQHTFFKLSFMSFIMIYLL